MRSDTPSPFAAIAVAALDSISTCMKLAPLDLGAFGRGGLLECYREKISEKQ
jgi:hypothetical protein